MVTAAATATAAVTPVNSTTPASANPSRPPSPKTLQAQVSDFVWANMEALQEVVEVSGVFA